MDKKATRIRRARRTRAKIRELGAYRLCIYRTPRHIYAQIIAPNGSEVVATASTVQADVKGGLKSTGNVAAAVAVGKAIAEKAKAAGITQVAFDRSNTMVGSRRWRMPRARTVCKFKG